MRATIALISIAATVALFGCTSESDSSGPTTISAPSAVAMKAAPAGPTIYDVAKAASTSSTPEFTVLVAALEAAGLDGALDGKGQFTVFAPTDDAFADLVAARSAAAAPRGGGRGCAVARPGGPAVMTHYLGIIFDAMPPAI